MLQIHEDDLRKSQDHQRTEGNQQVCVCGCGSQLREASSELNSIVTAQLKSFLGTQQIELYINFFDF